MGRSQNQKQKQNKREAALPGIHKRPIMTLREESIGRKQFSGRGGGGGGARASTNVKTALKMQHLQNLALWAGGDASIPSLAAFLGNRLTICGEAAGTPLDQSLFPCHRCETMLQPGYNCTVRIEKNKTKARKRRNKSTTPTKNDVTYTCNFCSNRNWRRGTPIGHMKELFASKSKSVSKLKPILPMERKSMSSEIATEANRAIASIPEEMVISPNVPSGLKSNVSTMHIEQADKPVESNPKTPVKRVQKVLLEGKKRKKSGSGPNKQVGTNNEAVTIDTKTVAGPSSRKRRKSWSSLKEIAENDLKNSRSSTTLTIPFFL